jgi:hypothetical protein
MKLPNTSYRIIAIITMVVSVIGLVMSPVSAAGAYSPSDSTAGSPAGTIAYHHVFNSTQQAARLQTVFTNLSQQGVDVSHAQADLAAGNVTAAVQWLTAYHKNNPDLALNGPRQHAVNATAQAARFQTTLARFSQNGVDVSQAQADLAAGNITGAMQDLMALHKDHPGIMGNSTRQAGHLQTEVTKLSGQGVDVSVIQADLDSANVNAAIQWMAAYHTAHPFQNGNATTWHGGNSTQMHKGGSFQPYHAGAGNQTASHQSFPWTGHRMPQHMTGT